MEILNREAKHNYFILDTYVAGIVLTGTEIKSIRNGKCHLKDSYGIIKNNEIYLLNMYISEYEKGNRFNHDETRTRKLLLTKKEILKIKNKIDLEGLTLIPLKLFFKNGLAKIELGICKGKKTYDKKETLKEKDLMRELAKSTKFH